MFSNFFKTFLALMVIAFLMWGFSDSYSAANIDNIAHITAIAIDKNDNPSADLKVSFQFVDVSGGGSESSSESSVIVIGVNSNTISNAISQLNAYIGKEVNLSHCRNIIFSREFASQGIAPEIYTLINNVQMRPSTNIVISTSDASDYLKNSNPNVEELISKYYDTFELTSNFTGFSDDATLGRFYDNILRTGTGNTAILGETFAELSSKSSSDGSSQSSSGGSSQSGEGSGGSSQSGGSSNENSQSSGDSSGSSQSSGDSQSADTTGSNSQSDQSSNNSSKSESQSSSNTKHPILEESAQRGTQNIGIAVFKDDTYIGELSSEESMYHLLVTNNIDSFVISVPIEGYSEGIINFQISPYKKTKISIDTSSDTPSIKIDAFCEAYVLSIDRQKNYGNIDFIDKTSPIVEKYLKENISSYLNRTSKEFKVDIPNFYEIARANFLTIPEWNNYNWNDKYQNANFSVNVNLNLNSQLLFIENE